MTVLVNCGAGFNKKVSPIEYETEASQRLVDAANYGDTDSAFACVANHFVDLNFVGTVSLKSKTTEIVLQDGLPHQVLFGYEEFKTEVTALFLAAHNGNLTLLRKLLRAGASVNMKLFRDYATTASVREGDLKVLEVLINNGASQIACEEALMESSHFGRPRFAELLMQSDMIRPEVAVHALVSACCRGFVEVVDVLIKHGVDANAIDRTLLQSSKPFLYANVDCNALFAAVVSRQINVVRLLLQVGVRRDIKVKLGAWSWETDTGEESRVGVGLAEAYPITWCAVEYFESTGSILKMLLCPCSLNSWHIGRTLLHHAIVCDNEKAVTILLNSGEFTELAVQTTEETNVHPIHMAARFGSCNILKSLINAGCNLDSQTKSGDTALMICIRHKHEECLRVLASAGADLGLVNSFGQCATSIANSLQWTEVFHKVILDVIRARKVVKSSNASRFSALLFVTQANNIKGLKRLIENKNLDIDEQNGNGFSAAMIAVADGSVEAFKLLLYAGADVAKLKNKNGLTALDLIEMNPNEEVFHKVIIKYALKKGRNASIEMKPLHIAARYGDIDSAHKLLNEGYDVNALDGHGYTPLMLAARGCHVDMCKLLLSHDAKCYIENEKHETALSLARENGRGNDAERVIMDEQARRLVLYGANVMKHTKCGKGSPHSKVLVMVEDAGILKWGKSNKRKVVCKEAVVGTSKSFRWNRRKKFDVDDPGMFHVITTEGKQVHFVCEGGIEMAEMWVRGIRLVTTEAIFGRKR
ncbi:uncharacterized protein LOC133285467 [Gastrolobium bilobum]|uniref:uncharacterized protein LOC133285467 n=1 Tax=Gastrolobium bilobum TaxID=150636 RepID=UPI002AB30E5C|nr:uncharacterized protein LOC133285467 [Gastrolobium bilobum]